MLDDLIIRQPRKIVAREVRHDRSVGEFGLGAVGADDDGRRGEVEFFVGGEGRAERLGRPFVYELVDFLPATPTPHSTHPHHQQPPYTHSKWEREGVPSQSTE